MRLSLVFILIFMMVGCISKQPQAELCAQRSPSSEALQCRSIFSEMPLVKLPLNYEKNYTHLGLTQQRLGPAENGHIPVLIKKIYSLPIPDAHLVSEISSKTQKPMPANFVESKESNVVNEHNLAAWNNTMLEAIDYVLNQYAERREHWPESFREKLKKLALDYQDFSTYITVKSIEYQSKIAKVWGTLRLIEERNGRLPMEDYLGIQINSKGARKFEPGNFAIDRSVNQYAFGEIIVHLIETVLEKSQKQESHFYTYADRQSLMLYKMLGFKPIERGDFTLDPAVKMDDRGRIEKDGVLWTPLQVSRKDLQLLLQNYLKGDLAAHGDPDVREAMEGRDQAIRNDAVFQDSIFKGMRSEQGKELVECALHLRKIEGKEGVSEIEVLFAKGGRSQAFRGWESFKIPNAPLREGYSYEQKINDHTKYTVFYQQGVLHYLETSDLYADVVHYKIKISSDLTTVEYVKILPSTDGDYSLEAFF